MPASSQAALDFKIQLEGRVEAEGTAFISSSTADENSQESDRLRGLFFSHHLVNALRGAADRNSDGLVTLAECYEYTYAQTLRSSGQTLSIQHPTYYRSVAYDQLIRKRGGVRRSVHGILLQGGVGGEVLAGEGVTPNLGLGYDADLPCLTVGARLRTDTATFLSVDATLPTRRYELGLGLVLQRYIDLPALSLAFGVSLEGIFEAQRFGNEQRQAASRNTLAIIRRPVGAGAAALRRALAAP